ncbi:MAG: hypothetical protein EBR82_64940 [Caulobacteraceae bacterium]|nr:hypothetical protein [Caulobacteraceae bacterium]
MAVFTQLPGTLDITFVQGDEVAIAVDFDRNLTGFQITAPVYVTAVYAAGGGGSSFVETVGATAVTFSISNTNLAQGQILLGLSETQTGQLSPAIAYRWYMRWADTGLVTRTVLSGTVTVTNP